MSDEKIAEIKKRHEKGRSKNSPHYIDQVIESLDYLHGLDQLHDKDDGWQTQLTNVMWWAVDAVEGGAYPPRVAPEIWDAFIAGDFDSTLGVATDGARHHLKEADDDRAFLLDEIERLTRERDEARAVISTLEIVGKAADDKRAQLRAEVERLTEWQSINHSEQHKLGWSMTEFCEGKRDHLHEMWERPPSLDYGIAHIEAEIKRLRAHNARLRAQIAEYFAEPTTHPVEDAE